MDRMGWFLSQNIRYCSLESDLLKYDFGSANLKLPELSRKGPAWIKRYFFMNRRVSLPVKRLALFLFHRPGKYPGKPPKVHPYASKHQVAIPKSGDALLACVGENTPDRDTFVFWVFNGTSLPLDNNENIHHQSDFEYFQEQETPKVNFSLLIRNVTERDTGAYHCGVRTLKGNDSDTIYLSLVKPGICMQGYTMRPCRCVRALFR